MTVLDVVRSILLAGLDVESMSVVSKRAVSISSRCGTAAPLRMTPENGNSSRLDSICLNSAIAETSISCNMAVVCHINILERYLCRTCIRCVS